MPIKLRRNESPIHTQGGKDLAQKIQVAKPWSFHPYFDPAEGTICGGWFVSETAKGDEAATSILNSWES